MLWHQFPSHTYWDIGREAREVKYMICDLVGKKGEWKWDGRETMVWMKQNPELYVRNIEECVGYTISCDNSI